MTIAQALGTLVRHPVQHLVRHWNWKAALLSAIIRGAIFFTTNLAAGLPAALLALGLDVPLRLLIAGFYGAIAQALRRGEPAWAANLTAITVILVLTHGLEFVVHFFGGTPRLTTAIAVSVAYSAISAVFNLFLMRRGALLVGPGGASLGDDLRRLPRLTVEFLRAIVMLVAGAGRTLTGRRRTPSRAARPGGEDGAARRTPEHAGRTFQDPPHYQRVSRDFGRDPHLLPRGPGRGEP